jgi:predicted RNase H-like HicB family nuclease
MSRMTVKVELPLLLWKEDDQVVAYTPALELSSSGDSEKEAITNFGEAVELFFETAEDRNVLKDLLESLGWTFQANMWKSHKEPVEGNKSYTAEVPVPQIS